MRGYYNISDDLGGSDLMIALKVMRSGQILKVEPMVRANRLNVW